MTPTGAEIIPYLRIGHLIKTSPIPEQGAHSNIVWFLQHRFAQQRNLSDTL